MFINMLLIHTLLFSDRPDRTSVCQVNVVGGRDWWDNDDGSTVADKKGDVRLSVLSRYTSGESCKLCMR